METKGARGDGIGYKSNFVILSYTGSYVTLLSNTESFSLHSCECMQIVEPYKFVCTFFYFFVFQQRSRILVRESWSYMHIHTFLIRSSSSSEQVKNEESMQYMNWFLHGTLAQRERELLYHYIFPRGNRPKPCKLRGQENIWRRFVCIDASICLLLLLGRKT